MRCMEIRGGNRPVEQTVELPGLDLWLFSEPYHEARRGGDVHYVSLCGGGVISRILLADVSGHGEAVAEASSALRSLMRKNINSKTQTRLVQALNRQFAQLAQLQLFATAVVATYLATTDELTVCNAAHPRPLFYQASTGQWSILSEETAGSLGSPRNLPLGIDDRTRYDQFAIHLEPGDIVLFYTDALTEAVNPEGDLLGETGLLALATAISATRPEEIGQRLLEAVTQHRAGKPADDDVTLMVLAHNAGPPRRMSVGEKVDVYAKVFGIKSV